MAQGDILEILEKAIKPMSRGQIAQILQVNPCKVSRDIRMLLKYKEIKCVEIDCEQAMKFYSCHRRMLVYYI